MYRQERIVVRFGAVAQRPAAWGNALALLAVLACSGVAAAHQDLLLQIAELDQRLYHSPDDPELLVRRARLLLEHDDALAALDDLECALAQRPDLADAWIWRARAQARMGNLDDARRDADHAVELAPDYFHAYQTRAELAAARGDLAAAVADLERAAQLRPQPELFGLLAATLAEMGDVDGAAAALEAGILELHAPVALVLELIRFAGRHERHDVAMRWADALLAQPGRREPWLLVRARTLEAAGRNADAAHNYRDVLDGLERDRVRGRYTQLMALERAEALLGLRRPNEARAALADLGPAARQLSAYRELAARLDMPIESIEPEHSDAPVPARLSPP